MSISLSTTPLHAWHKSQGARMAEFAGFEMPIQYTSIVQEHEATRRAVTLFDISHMGRLRFDGPRADQLLDHLLTRRVTDMVVGQVRYGLICNEAGGILDDVLVSCLETPSSRNYFLLVVNASNRQKILRWIQPHLADFPDVELSDTTERTAMIAVQGPKAMETCRSLFPASVQNLGYYHAKVTDQMSKPCIVSRTGYTGEDGLELIVRSEDAPRVWENLLLAGRNHGIQAAGLGARDTLRLEAAMPLYGHELDESIDPVQAGLTFAVQTKDRDFIGRESILQFRNDPSRPKRIGLVLDGKRSARQGAEIFDSSSRSVGSVTSGSFSPTLQRPIAMAYVMPAMANPDLQLEADIRGSRSTATVVAMPFYKRDVKS